MTRKIPNLIIVAGDGRNAGKTTMCCRIIREFEIPGLVAIKISQHFHEPSEGLVLLAEQKGFAVYQETSLLTGKDSSEMLRCGASKVFYIQAEDKVVTAAVEEILTRFPAGSPVICESPSLISYYDPGVFIIMVSDNDSNRKDISGMKKNVHVEFSLEELKKVARLPFSWTGTEWKYL
jgi:hypothetical protein